MSAHVDLDQLAAALDDFTFAYLVTVNEGHRAHVVTVDPRFAEGIFIIDAAGDRTSTNLARHHDVTIIWPPGDPGGYTLLVDGRAELSSGTIKITPSRAVLHRPAAPETKQSTPGCLHDCVPLEE